MRTRPADYDLVYLEMLLGRVTTELLDEINDTLAKDDCIDRRPFSDAPALLVNEKTPISWAAFDAKVDLEAALSEWTYYVRTGRDTRPAKEGIEARIAWLLEGDNMYYLSTLPEWYSLYTKLTKAVEGLLVAMDLPSDMSDQIDEEGVPMAWHNIPQKFLDKYNTPAKIAEGFAAYGIPGVTREWVMNTGRNRKLHMVPVSEERVRYLGDKKRVTIISYPSYRFGDLLDIWIERTAKATKKKAKATR